MNYLGLLLFVLAGSVNAAPADWVSYLCRYKTDGAEFAQVVKVNEKQQRVTIDDRDATAVKFSANAINFGGPHGSWLITLPNGSMLTARGMKMANGTCTKIDD